MSDETQSEKKKPEEQPEGLTPASLQSPLKEFAKSVWVKYFGKWADFRAYIKQRSTMLADPSTITSHDKDVQKGWKSPLTFAVQGTVLVTFVVACLSGAFDLITKE